VLAWWGKGRVGKSSSPNEMEKKGGRAAGVGGCWAGGATKTKKEKSIMAVISYLVCRKEMVQYKWLMKRTLDLPGASDDRSKTIYLHDTPLPRRGGEVF